ncbi:hypothetical protein pb186bvf_009863 [Paramecium bursaria]
MIFLQQLQFLFFSVFSLQQILADGKYYDSSTEKSQLIDKNEFQNSSIWFKYQHITSQLNIIFLQTVDIDKKEFISIMNSKLVLSFQNQSKSHNVEKYDLTDWFHLSISITKKEFKLSFHQPYEELFLFKYNSSFSFIIEKSLQYKCFIFTEFTTSFYQIKQEWEYFKLVRPNQILEFFAYHSAFQTFLKKKIRSQVDDLLMSIYTKDLEIIIFFQKTGFIIQEEKYNVTEHQFDNWFQIIFYFELNQIQIDVVFIDVIHTVTHKLYQDNNQKQLYYNIQINFQTNNTFTIQKSNYYQFYEINQMEKCHPLCQQCDNGQCLKCYNEVCDCLKNQYFNQTVNKCILISEQYKIPLTSTQIKCRQGQTHFLSQCQDFCAYYEGSVAKSCYFDQNLEFYNYFSNIEDVLLRRIILSNQDSQYIQINFDASLPIKKNLILIDSILILPNNFVFQITQQDKLSFCRLNYSGIRCQYNLKKCLLGENKQCQFCYLGYYLYKSKCQKCQNQCQVCEYNTKKKIIQCLFPNEGYYINTQGNIRKCSKLCYLCNQSGECISKLQIQRYQKQCQKDKYCLFDKIVQCPENFILSFKDQSCYQIDSNSNILQYVQSTIEQNQPFLGDYTIPLIEQLIMSLINTDQEQEIFKNDQIEKILIFNQLRNQLLNKLDEQLSEEEESLLFSKGQICLQKKYYQKQLRCSEFKLSDKISQPEQKCFNENICKYVLVLQNVQVYTNSQYVIWYEDHEYISLTQLLNSIQDIGINYGSIIINATYYLRSQKEYEQEQQLMIKENELNPYLKGIQIILQINFYIQTNSSQPDYITIYLKADYLILQNLSVNSNYTLYLYVECEFLNINNTIILEGNFYLNIAKATHVLIQDTTIMTNFQMKEVYILTVDKIIDFNIKNFVIIQSFLNKAIFEFLENISYLKIEDFNIYYSNLFDLIIIKISDANVVKVENFNIGYSIFEISTIISIHTIISIYIQKLQILETQFFYTDEQIQLYEGNYLILNQINFELCSFNKSSFILVKNYHQISYSDSRIRISSARISIYMNLQAQKIKIQNIFMEIQDFNTVMIAKIGSYNINLDQLYIKHSGTSKNSQSEVDYLLQFTTYYGSFQNIYVDRFELHGQGILLIDNMYHIMVTNLTLDKIEIGYLSHKLPYVVLFQNFESQAKISQIYIQNIQTMDGDAQNIAIIAVIGRSDALWFDKAVVNSIHSISKQNYIFFFSNNKVVMHNVIVKKTSNFNFFQVQTRNSQFSKLIFENNKQNLEYFTLNSTAQFNHQTLLIYNVRVRDQNGSFFHNSYFNTILAKVWIFNLQINGIETVRLFVVDEIQFKLEDVKIIGYQKAVPQYVYIKELFACLYSQITIFNMTIVNTNIILGEFMKVKSLSIIQLSITDLHLEQDTFHNLTYISIVPIFKFIFKDIYISDSSLSNIILIYISTPIHKVKLQNVNFRNFQSDQPIFQFTFLQSSHQIYIDGAHFQHVYGEMALFDQEDLIFQPIDIRFNNFFIKNCTNPLITGHNQDIQIQINNSLISQLDSVNQQQINVDLLQSQIIYNKSINFWFTKQQNSLIFNEQLQQKTIHQELSIRLTFNQGKSFLNVLQLNNSHQIMFDRNPNSYFYLPSGQAINEYKRLYINQLKYEVIYKGFGIVLQGQQKIECNLTSTYNGEVIEVFNQKELILQEGLNIFNNLTSVINPYNSDYVQNELQCKNYTLRFNTKAFRCQLGEFIFNNQCLQCDISRGLYSTQYNSTHCYNVNYNQIEKLKIGLIKLRQNYWRYNYSTIYIEECPNQYQCNGGWRPGDSSCNASRIGALCQECDIYNQLGNGHFTKNINNCQICEITNYLIFQYLISVIWQILLNYLSYYSNNFLYRQFVLYKVGFKNFYQVLYRLSIDQSNLIIKFVLNYFFYMYLIRDNLNYTLQSFVININYFNNPNLLMSAQLDCLFQQASNVNIIYLKLFFSLLNVLIILNLIYFFYLISIKFRFQKFQIRFLLIITSDLFIYNLKIIIEISFKLLTYQNISGLKWVSQNLSYLYYSDSHIYMITNYVLPLTLILLFLPMLILLFIKMGVTIQIKLKKVLIVYYQSYKSTCFFWEYIFIYTRVLLIGVAILNNQQLQIQLLVIILLIFVILNIQPFYLKNINQIQLIILLVYLLDLTLLLIQQIDIIRAIGLISVNIYLIIFLFPLILQRIQIKHRQKLFDTKVKIVKKFPNLTTFLRPDIDERIFKNIQYLKNSVRRKYLLKKNSQDSMKADLPYQFLVSKITTAEIEMIRIK